MYKKYLFFALTMMFAGCGRQNLAPVEIKVDENGDIVGYEHLGPGTPTYGTTEPSASKPRVYVVKRNETLFDIAYRFDLDALTLAKINGISHPYTVREGQRLRLPDRYVVMEPSVERPMEKMVIPDEEQREKSSRDVASEENEKSEKVDPAVEKDFSNMLSAVTGGKSGKDGSTVAEKHEDSDALGKKMSFEDQEEALSKPKIKPAEKKSPKTGEAKKEPPAQTEKKEKKSSDGWVAPVQGKVISNYGDIVDGESNDGIDIKAAEGTPVKAASGGEVIFAGEGDKLSPSFGKTVIINHGKDTLSSYMHLKSVKVKSGDKVKSGHVIGTVGQTGSVNEPQLHFEVTHGEDLNSVDPTKYVKF